MPGGGCFRKSIGFVGVGPLAPKFGGTEPFFLVICAIDVSRMGMYLGIMGCGCAIENTHNRHFTYQL
jgi:hypothetical protein